MGHEVVGNGTLSDTHQRRSSRGPQVGQSVWYGRARWAKFGLLWSAVHLIIGGVVEFLRAIW